jgi:hypothetical protein
MAIAIIEGTGIVSANGAVRVVTPGAQVRIPLGGLEGLQAVGTPGNLEPFEFDLISLAPFGLLDRPVLVPPPISSGFMTPVPTPTMPGCTPRADWTYFYTVPSGDTLSGIAARIGISTATLAAGNCIVNPNILIAGQVIRAPRPVPIFVPHTATPTLTPTVTLTPSVTPTTPPPTANLSADSTTLVPNDCTNLHWTTTNATSASLDSASVSLNGSMVVCPPSGTDTTYTLTATGNGTASSSVTITVYSVCNNDGICQPYENSDTCNADCGNAPTTCGNGTCDAGETSATCPADCSGG